MVILFYKTKLEVSMFYFLTDKLNYHLIASNKIQRGNSLEVHFQEFNYHLMASKKIQRADSLQVWRCIGLHYFMPG